MELLTSLDPTAVCITFLIAAAFTLLWLYVSMTGARREQPNLSALYKQTSLRPSSTAAGQSSRSPRAAAVKGKGKSKQVESSPRASVQKSTPSETAAISSEKAALPTQQAAQTGKVSSDAPAPASKPAAGSKGKKKRQAAQVSETDAAQKPQLEEGDEGEWQTQLSRQQLKALRQKQKKEKEKAAKREKAAEREEVSKSSSSDTDSKQVSTATPSSSDNGDGCKKEREVQEPSSKSKEVSEERVGKSEGSRRGKGKRQKASEKSPADTGAKSTQKSSESTENQLVVEKEEDKATSSERTGSGTAVSACVSDVEEALKDAARSTSTSPEADKQSAETEAPFTEVKSKSHRKQKATIKESSSPQDQPSLDTGEHDEEWVVIEGESLT